MIILFEGVEYENLVIYAYADWNLYETQKKKSYKCHGNHVVLDWLIWHRLKTLWIETWWTQVVLAENWENLLKPPQGQK